MQVRPIADLQRETVATFEEGEYSDSLRLDVAGAPILRRLRGHICKELQMNGLYPRPTANPHPPSSKNTGKTLNPENEPETLNSEAANLTSL